jgi:hypothetical protein
MIPAIRPAALAVVAAFTAVLGGCSPSAGGDVPALVQGPAVAAVPADGNFYPFLCNGQIAGDVVGDPVTGGNWRDIVGGTVGDATYPAFYRAADATHVFFRMRVSGDPRKPGSDELQPSSWDVLVDTDGNLSTYEFMLTADGNLGGTRVQWVRNSVKEPGNPMDPANDTRGDVTDLSPASDYWTATPTGDGSAFGGDGDFFMTLAIPRATLTGAGLDLTKAFSVWGGTNASNYSLNADYGCVVGMDFNLGDGSTDPGPLDPTHVPDATPDHARTDEDAAVTTAVLANDSGLADMPIVVTIESQPVHGSAVVSGTSVTYTPDADWNGTDTYSYSITDADGQADTATVTVTVVPVNDAPVAIGDNVVGSAGVTAIPVDVLANDTDVDGDLIAISAVTQGANGSVTVADGLVVYLPSSPQFQGTDSFTYTVQDPGGLSATAAVTVTIGPAIDQDDDGLPDWVEDDDGDGHVTDPLDPDTDDDGLEDGTEDSNHDGDVDPGETDPLNPDTDGDGLQDGTEDTDKDGTFDPGETDPLNPDTDGDGLMDGVEDADKDGTFDPGETDPRNPDTDGDGLQDGVEDTDRDGTFDAGETDPRNPDTDGDGIRDGVEDADRDGTFDVGETDPRNPDTDGDGLRDGVEDANQDGTFDFGETDPRDPDTDDDGLGDGVEDSDHDGIIGAGETDPRHPDTDRDGILDGVEDADRDRTVDPGETDPLDPDSDDDGLVDGVEDADRDGTFEPGETDPLDPDTDGDALLDGVEDADHDGTFEPGETNPRTPDTDDDALADGREDVNHSGEVDAGETDPRVPDYGISGGGCSSGRGGATSLVLIGAALLGLRRRRAA